jgi:hypothetical protein
MISKNRMCPHIFCLAHPLHRAYNYPAVIKSAGLNRLANFISQESPMEDSGTSHTGKRSSDQNVSDDPFPLVPRVVYTTVVKLNLSPKALE